MMGGKSRGGIYSQAEMDCEQLGEAWCILKGRSGDEKDRHPFLIYYNSF